MQNYKPAGGRGGWGCSLISFHDRGIAAEPYYGCGDDLSPDFFTTWARVGKKPGYGCTSWLVLAPS